jgi:cold shock CspA family protein
VTGVVTSFDDHRGDGEIRSDQGESFYLHCVEIADGSRTIAVGARVSFVPRPGLLGEEEATMVHVLEANPQSRS